VRANQEDIISSVVSAEIPVAYLAAHKHNVHPKGNDEVREKHMTNGEITLADLAKKMDDQSRFTRSVSVICTLAILGVMFYTLTEMFSNLPSAIVLHYMANMDKIVHEWNEIQANNVKRGINVPGLSGSPK
jgi:hypothetical protein